MDCVFCKIIKGELPSHKVFEDENILVFLDNFPVVAGHTLVITKNHVKWVWDLDDKGYVNLMQKTKAVANALRKVFGTEFVSEGIIGKDVPHAHVHVMPRKIDDGLGAFPGQELSPRPTDDQFKKIAEDIKKNL